MITLEKMLILKSVRLFNFTPEETLLAVISAIKERHVQPGECILQKDALGSSMFIIVKGKVKVHDGDHLLNTLEEGSVFGELAALSPEKRIASVTALDECLLFEIDHASLNDLIDWDPGLAKGIIQELCRRARDIMVTK
jgi:CRP/FNR family transcriptional regulator, cyclic AMP receptor protein